MLLLSVSQQQRYATFMYAKAPKVLLNEKHLTFTQLPDLLSICRPFLQQCGLNAFFILDFSVPGQAAVITTHPSVNQYFFANQLIARGDELKPGIRFMPSSSACQARAEMGRRFNVDNGLEIVKKKGEGSIIYGFASSCEKPDMVNYYFNHLERLEQFIAEFQDRAKPMIVHAKQNPILIPGHNHLIKDNIEQPKKITVNTGNLLVNISHREIEVLVALYQGLTAKETAQRMNLSHRTVEAYLENIKNKLGINKKFELVKFITSQNLSSLLLNHHQ